MWYSGFLDLSAWQLVGVTLLMTHVTIISVTLYLHRYSAHRALELNAGLKHFFRFWLWLTTAQNTREWTAIHRKHHAKCETPDDPTARSTRVWAPCCARAPSSIAKRPATPRHCASMARTARTTGSSATSIRATSSAAWP